MIWGEYILSYNEGRISKLSKEDFEAVQAEGAAIFECISDNMPKGHDSKEVQAQIVRWRNWLENFAEYSDEAVLGLGQAYSQNQKFIDVFQNIHEDLPDFLTKAIEYYCAENKSKSDEV